MVEQMVCKRDKAHCSPIRRRFLTPIVAALLLTTAEAQTERVPWSKRTKTSALVARRDARAKQEHGPAAIFASMLDLPPMRLSQQPGGRALYIYL